MSRQFIISVVDDDDIYRFTILKTVKKLGLSRKTIAFSDGKEALDFIIQKMGSIDDIPDVILLDVNMPVMDGFEFMKAYTRLLPTIGKKIKVFMISSSVNPEDIDRAKGIPEIIDYIVKPIEPGKLVRIIADLEKGGHL